MAGVSEATYRSGGMGGLGKRVWAVVAAVGIAGAAVAAADTKPAETKPAETKPGAAGAVEIKGTYTFGGTPGPWSAKLTPKAGAEGTFDATYTSVYKNKTSTWKGTITSDFKTELKGTGKGGAGTFEFAGKFGGDGVAKCEFKEVGGMGRKGTITAGKE